MLLRCCVLSTSAVVLMILQDLAGTGPIWHWASDAAAALAVTFCWWNALRPQPAELALQS
jgi:hypothetical protein